MRFSIRARRWQLTLVAVAGLAAGNVAADELVPASVEPTTTEAISPESVEIEATGSVDETLLDHKIEAPCKCCNSVCCTKKKKEALAAQAKGAYKGVFYANDFSYLDDPCYDGHNLGDSLKGMWGGRLDVGGEVRVRYHHENNIRGLGLTGRDDEFWLTRYRMFSNWRISDNFRFYGEFLYADSGGDNFASRPIEENRGEAQNLFIDATLFDTDAGNLKARIGRQELLYGNQRLISPLDWANTRRTFDGYRLLFKGTNWDIDGFFTNPVKRTPAYVDKWDSADSLQDFFGVYATRKGLDIGTVDLYYLGYTNDNAGRNFDYHTIGSRVAGGTDLLYEFEGGVQFGNQFAGSDQGAGFFTGGIGRKLSICTPCGEWTPTIWGWYDWASGDDQVPAARNDNSFDHLFPLAHKYNGFMDLFGRRNLNDVNAQFITPLLGKKVSMLLWYHYFFLDQKTTPYGVTMIPFNPGNAAGDRELGHEIDLLFNVNLDQRNSVLLGYSYFHAGDYYNTTAGIPNAVPARSNSNADFYYFQYQTRF